MSNRCLYCYKETPEGVDFHPVCSLAFFGMRTPPKLPYSIDKMNELAKDVIDRSVSVPGVQAKLSMSVIKEVDAQNSRLTVVGALGGNYIFKPPNSNFPEMPQNEHATMRLAEKMGINVVPSSLIRLASGELSYITKRIDRTTEGKKTHMLDMFQLTEAVDKYKSSMEKVGKAIDTFSENTLLDKLYFFELSLFCFLTGNNDMHLKNFSLIETKFGWTLSPAYDLLNVAILNPDDDEELALPIDGRKKKLNGNRFQYFGSKLGLTDKQIKLAFRRFTSLPDQADKLIQKSFLSNDMQKSYIDLIASRYHSLYD